jgi:hypothetical protein
MNLASEYHLWASTGAVDNALYLYAHAGLWKVDDIFNMAAIATPIKHRDALHVLFLQPMNLASEYHPWASTGAVDNAHFLHAHACLWKVEDFLNTAAIATPMSIEMLYRCYTCNQ